MFIWAPCYVMCPAILIGWDPAIPSLPPHLDSYYEGAISQQRQTISLCNPLKPNLKRSDSVAGWDDEVVVAGLEPEVSVLVLRGAVTRQVEVAAEGVRRRLLVPQVPLNQHPTWNSLRVIRIWIYNSLEKERIRDLVGSPLVNLQKTRFLFAKDLRICHDTKLLLIDERGKPWKQCFKSAGV